MNANLYDAIVEGTKGWKTALKHYVELFGGNGPAVKEDINEYRTDEVCVFKRKRMRPDRSEEIPDMGPDDVLVKQLVCNICTTDYGQWLGLREHQGYPMAGGHEGSGIVEAVGSGVKDLKPGDHVAVAYNSCGKCEACRRGHEGQCTSADYKNLTEDGYRGNFGFADYNVRSARNLVKMNPETPPQKQLFWNHWQPCAKESPNCGWNLRRR